MTAEEIDAVEAITYRCEECHELCEPKHRAEYGLWKKEDGTWFALHRWCAEVWMKVHRPRK